MKQNRNLTKFDESIKQYLIDTHVIRRDTPGCSSTFVRLFFGLQKETHFWKLFSERSGIQMTPEQACKFFTETYIKNRVILPLDIKIRIEKETEILTVQQPFLKIKDLKNIIGSKIFSDIVDRKFYNFQMYKTIEQYLNKRQTIINNKQSNFCNNDFCYQNQFTFIVFDTMRVTPQSDAFPNSLELTI